MLECIPEQQGSDAAVDPVCKLHQIMLAFHINCNYSTMGTIGHGHYLHYIVKQIQIEPGMYDDWTSRSDLLH